MSAQTPIGFRKWLTMESESGTGTALPSAVLHIVDQMQSWIERYVSQHLHIGGSIWDFWRRFPQRLASNVAEIAPQSEPEIRHLIQKTVTDLVHDQNRTEDRRDGVGRYVPLTEYVDPKNNVEQQLIEQEEQELRQSKALALLQSLSPDQRILIEQLYGLKNREPKSRREIAKRLGLRRNTVDQRLRRALNSLRKIGVP